MSTPVRRRTPPEEGVLHEAVALHRAGRLEAAEGAYRRFLARRRSHPFALQNLGLLLHQRGDFAGSREALERAVASARKSLKAGIVNLEAGRCSICLTACRTEPTGSVRLPYRG